MMKLYGSTTSPYVRRIRMLLANVEHEFINMQIFAGKDRDVLLEKNPTLKIPMLEDGEDIIYDSRVIFRYLANKYDLPALTWKQENLLTVIDSINDSLVQLLLLQRSEIESADDKLYFKLQNERVAHAFNHLNEEVLAGEFEHWEYPTICLFCLVDWTAFRQLHDLSDYSHLLDFAADHKERIEASATDPRE
ncbi:MAG: glutathione S-transferase family protein [Alteromonadaceae bacterium]|nr:glutathione S-transferase family protein [Alteromonadaceae bacterium]